MSFIETHAIIDKWNARQIHEALLRGSTSSSTVPSQRTISRIIKDLAVVPDDTPWSLVGDIDIDLAPVLETMRSLVMKARRSPRLSVREAELIARIHRACPSLEAHARWILARLYIGREDRGKDSHALDDLLAMKPWETDEAAHDYRAAVSSGYVEEAPSWELITGAELKLNWYPTDEPGDPDQQSTSHTKDER